MTKNEYHTVYSFVHTRPRANILDNFGEEYTKSIGRN